MQARACMIAREIQIMHELLCPDEPIFPPLEMKLNDVATCRWVPPPRTDMGRGVFALCPIPTGRVLETAVVRESVHIKAYERGWVIVQNSNVFDDATYADGWKVRGNLVYFVNCADETLEANVRYGRRGNRLVLVALRPIAAGAQIIVRDYLEEV